MKRIITVLAILAIVATAIFAVESDRVEGNFVERDSLAHHDHCREYHDGHHEYCHDEDHECYGRHCRYLCSGRDEYGCCENSENYNNDSHCYRRHEEDNHHDYGHCGHSSRRFHGPSRRGCHR